MARSNFCEDCHREQLKQTNKKRLKKQGIIKKKVWVKKNLTLWGVAFWNFYSHKVPYVDENKKVTIIENTSTIWKTNKFLGIWRIGTFSQNLALVGFMVFEKTCFTDGQTDGWTTTDARAAELALLAQTICGFSLSLHKINAGCRLNGSSANQGSSVTWITWMFIPRYNETLSRAIKIGSSYNGIKMLKGFSNKCWMS